MISCRLLWAWAHYTGKRCFGVRGPRGRRKLLGRVLRPPAACYTTVMPSEQTLRIIRAIRAVAARQSRLILADRCDCRAPPRRGRGARCGAHPRLDVGGKRIFLVADRTARMETIALSPGDGAELQHALLVREKGSLRCFGKVVARLLLGAGGRKPDRTAARCVYQRQGRLVSA
jgi:hypothetical protein